MIKALKNKDEDVRKKAVSALGEIGDVRAVEPLTKVANNTSEEENIRKAAKEALEKIGGEEVTEPSPTIQFRSLSTGTFLVKKLSGGYGELTIENGRDLDAVGVLASSRELKIPLIAVYIQSEDSFTIKGIEDDMYTIYFTLGEDWDSDLEKFTRKATYARFEEELEFETTETATEIRYMTFTVTLHPVVGGTAETEPVREADFPELSN